MNLVDLIIIGTLGLLALMGLRSGILVPVSGVAGVILGVVLATQYHGQLAFALTEHVVGETVRRVAACGHQHRTWRSWTVRYPLGGGVQSPYKRCAGGDTCCRREYRRWPC